MTKKQFRNRVRLLIVLTLVLVSLTSVAVGKYMTTLPKHEGAVSFTARLAEKVEVVNNDYRLIPGYDFETDSYVNVVGKTGIPANLRIEVSSTNPAVSWTLDAGNWKEQDGTYYYWDFEKDQPKEITADLNNINIFEKIYVSDQLLSKEGNTLTVTATLEEIP